MIVGTAGHIDHGKTALVRALTGVDADRLPEEKARGITIDLGFAYRPIAGSETLGFVDVPGHERFVHNMLAGAAGIDFVLLVVAADDGPMPQTREHLQILDLLGLSEGIVALTKSDLASAGRIAEVRDEIHALLAETSLANAEIVGVSSVTGAGVPELEAKLLAAAAKKPLRTSPGGFRLAVDRCFSLSGAGTIVTGTVFAGHVAVGDHLILSPSGLEARVRGIHAQNAAAQTGQAGQRCAINLAGPHVDKEHIQRGDWLLSPAIHAPTDRIDARIRLLPTETKPLRHWSQVHLHLGATHVSARVALLDGLTLAPGAAGRAQLVLDQPIGALHGDRLILRDQSAERTIGGGMALDPWPPARNRRKPERLAALDALDTLDAKAALDGLLAIEPGWVDLPRFARAWNLTAESFDAKVAGSFAFSAARWEALAKMVIDALTRHHSSAPQSPGLEAEKLRLALPQRLPPEPFAALLAGLVADKKIEADGPWRRLPGHKLELSSGDEKLWARIQPLIAASAYQPPKVGELALALKADEKAVRQLLLRLSKLGPVRQVVPDRFFLRESLAELATLAAALAGTSPTKTLPAAAFRDKIGTGRKAAIEILEYFDKAGITARRGDERVVRPMGPAGYFQK